MYKMLHMKKEGSRCSWSMEETKELLAIMKEKKLMEQLDGNTRRNNNIYVLISNEITKKGFNKSCEKVKLKVRTLKAAFMRVKRANSKSVDGRSSMNHYDDLNELLGDRPVAAAVGTDTTAVETTTQSEMEEEHLDECDVMDSDAKRAEKVQKKRNAIQMTFLEIAADVKESQQCVIKTMKEENEKFIPEERRRYNQYNKDTKDIMTEDRRATKEMLLELFNKEY